MAKDDPDMWFEPKRYGYGAGLPVAPQGWALLIGYMVVVTAAAWLLLMGRWWGYVIWIGVVVGATAAFMAIVAQHTRGGWRWRWGGEE